VQQPATPTRRRPFFGWYIVAGSVLTNGIFSAAYFQGFSALILPIEATFGWSRSTISGAGALRQLESGIVSPFVGILLDRFSARTLVFWSAVISGLAMIGLAFMNGVVTFYLFFVLVSLGASGLSHAVTWPVLIARWFRRKRGLAVGLAVMGPIIGSPFVILNTSLEDAFGWRAVLFGYGVLILLACTPLSLLARDRPEPYGLRPDGDPPEAQTGTAEEAAARIARQRIGTGWTLREVLRMREFWVLTAFLAGMFVVNSAFQFHQIPYFEEDKDFSSAQAATTLMLVFFASGFGRIGSGFLLDKLDYRMVLAVVSAMMGGAFLYVQLAPVHAVHQALPFVVLFGVGFGSMIPLRGALGGMLFGTRAIGSVVGLLQGGAVAAGVIGPIFMGVLFDLQGDYATAIWVLVVVSVIMAPVAFIMRSPATLARQRAESGRF
jgi:sugar phosphate permease